MKTLLACAALALAAAGVTRVGFSDHSSHSEAAHISANDPQSGYGSCSVYGCNCRAYEGSGNTCSNCGHNYYRHY